MASKSSGAGTAVLSVVEILIVIVVAFFVLRFLAAMGGAGSGGGLSNGGVGGGGADSLAGLGQLLSALMGGGNSGGTQPSINFGGGSGGGLFGNGLSSGGGISQTLSDAISGIDTPEDWASLFGSYDSNEDAIDSFGGLIPSTPLQGLDVSQYAYTPDYSASEAADNLDVTEPDDDSYIDDGGGDDGDDGD